MGFGGAMFAVSAASAVSQISQGYAQKAESDYNATLLEGKANIINEKASIEQGQLTREGGQYMSKSVATAAKQGIGLSGSALAVMLNTQTQVNIDKTISQFNYDQERNYTLAEADAQRRAGKSAVRSGYAGAFSELLKGASTYAMYKFSPKTTFDTLTVNKQQNALQAFGGGVKPYTPPKMSILKF